MSTEALYYQTLLNTSTISNMLGNRVYPVKLPQNVTYPALMYDVEANIEAMLDASCVTWGLFSFSNTFYASSYSDIIKITEALRDVSQAKGWNIEGFADLEFSTENNVFARTLIVNINSQI
jgi:hypothetical protein